MHFQPQNSTNSSSTFGSVMPGRAWSDENRGYRYGFNGMERDDEVKGSGNSLDFGARVYDSRLGRWLALDPMMAKYPNLSDYSFVSNNPVILIDEDGREIKIKIDNNPNSEPMIYTPNMAVPENASKFLSDVINGLNYIHNTTMDKEGVSKVSDLVESKFVLSIVETKEFMSTNYEQEGDENIGTVNWNNLEVLIYDEEGKNKQSPIVGLAHELDHAWKRETILSEAHRTGNFDLLIDEQVKSEYSQKLPEERRATFGLESEIAKSLGQYQQEDYGVPVKVYATENIFSTLENVETNDDSKKAINRANDRLTKYHNSDLKKEHEEIKKNTPKG